MRRLPVGSGSAKYAPRIGKTLNTPRTLIASNKRVTFNVRVVRRETILKGKAGQTVLSNSIRLAASVEAAGLPRKEGRVIMRHVLFSFAAILTVGLLGSSPANAQRSDPDYRACVQDCGANDGSSTYRSCVSDCQNKYDYYPGDDQNHQNPPYSGTTPIHDEYCDKCVRVDFRIERSKNSNLANPRLIFQI